MSPGAKVVCPIRLKVDIKNDAIKTLILFINIILVKLTGKKRFYIINMLSF